MTQERILYISEIEHHWGLDQVQKTLMEEVISVLLYSDWVDIQMLKEYRSFISPI